MQQLYQHQIKQDWSLIKKQKNKNFFDLFFFLTVCMIRAQVALTLCVLRVLLPYVWAPPGCTSGPADCNPGQWLSVLYQVADHKTRFVKIKLVRSALLEF